MTLGQSGSSEAKWIPGLRRTAGSPHGIGRAAAKPSEWVDVRNVGAAVADLEHAISEAAAARKSVWVLIVASALYTAALFWPDALLIRLLVTAAPSSQLKWVGVAFAILFLGGPGIYTLYVYLRTLGSARRVRRRLFVLTQSMCRDELVARAVVGLISDVATPNLAWLGAGRSDFAQATSGRPTPMRAPSGLSELE